MSSPFSNQTFQKVFVVTILLIEAIVFYLVPKDFLVTVSANSDQFSTYAKDFLNESSISKVCRDTLVNEDSSAEISKYKDFLVKNNVKCISKEYPQYLPEWMKYEWDNNIVDFVLDNELFEEDRNADSGGILYFDKGNDEAENAKFFWMRLIDPKSNNLWAYFFGMNIQD